MPSLAPLTLTFHGYIPGSLWSLWSLWPNHARGAFPGALVPWTFEAAAFEGMSVFHICLNMSIPRISTGTGWEKKC